MTVFFNWMQLGGPLMWPLLLSSIVALTLFLDRFFVLSLKRQFPQPLISDVRDALKASRANDLQKICSLHNLPLTRIISRGLGTDNPGESEAQMNIQSQKEILNLEKNVQILGTIAAIAPLLGLLGTVTGMIQTFFAVKEVGIGNPLALSGGISEALINTAAGLLVGIPALFCYRYLLGKLDYLGLEFDEYKNKVAGLAVTK